MIGDFFHSGHVVDFILVVLAAEFLFVSWRRRARAQKARPVDLILALAPGACLLLALRAALTGAGWVWVGAILAISLPIHVADLRRRGF